MWIDDHSPPKTVVFDTPTTVIRTLFLKLMLASEYSSHFKDKDMPTSALSIQIFYSLS
jgi:hypothetical protein